MIVNAWETIDQEVLQIELNIYDYSIIYTF